MEQSTVNSTFVANTNWRIWMVVHAGVAGLFLAWSAVWAGDESGTPAPSIARSAASASADAEVTKSSGSAIETRIEIRVGAIGEERTLPIRMAARLRLLLADGRILEARGQEVDFDHVSILFPGGASGDGRLQVSLSREAGMMDAGRPGRTAVLDLPVSINAPSTARTMEPAGLGAALGPGMAVIDRIVSDSSGVAVIGHFTGFSTEELQAIHLIDSTLATRSGDLRVYAFRGGFGDGYAQFELVFAGKDAEAETMLALRLGTLPAQPGRPTPERLAASGLQATANIPLNAAN